MSDLEIYAIGLSLFTFPCIVFPMAISEVSIVRMNDPNKSRYCNTGFSHNIFILIFQMIFLGPIQFRIECHFLINFMILSI